MLDGASPRRARVDHGNVVADVPAIAASRARFDLPIAAYQVSGEFAMVAAAAERGWLDGRRAMTEAVTAIVRAGAGIVVTYAAAELATWIQAER